MRLLLSLFIFGSSAWGEVMYHCEDRYGDIFHVKSKLTKTENEIRFDLYSLTGLEYPHPLFNQPENPVVRLEVVGKADKLNGWCQVGNRMASCSLNPTQVTLTWKNGRAETFSRWNSWFALHEITKRTFTGSKTVSLVSEFYVGMEDGSIHPAIHFREHRCQRNLPDGFVKP